MLLNICLCNRNGLIFGFFSWKSCIIYKTLYLKLWING